MKKRKLLPVSVAAISAAMLSAPTMTLAKGFELEEVIVTARKTEENIQSIPIAINAFSAEDLQSKNITETTQLSTFTPGLFIETNSANNLSSAKTTIRGQVQVDTLSTLDPSVGWYIDDVYLARTYGTVGSMFDVANVEVLKGPQGTLYGRNTTGGAIKLVTTKAEPSAPLGGYVTAGAGNLGAHKVGGAVNIPIIDDVLAVRLTALSDKVEEGYGSVTVTRLAVAGLYPNNSLIDFQTHKAKAGQKNSQLYRVGATWTPSDDLSVHLYYEKTDFYANALLLNYFDAPAIGYKAPTDLFKGGANNHLHETWTDANTASLTTEYEFTDSLNTKLVLGYRDMTSKFISDVDGTTLPINYSLSPLHQDATQTSMEWQLLGNAMNGSLDWVTGLYYFEEWGRDWSNTNGAGSIPSGIFGGTYNANIEKNRSRSAFFSGTLHLTDSVNFNGGLRYTKDSKPVSVNAEVLRNPSTGATACRFDISLAPNANPSNCTWSNSANYEYMSWTAGFDWTINADVMAYIKTSSASRAGGQNLRGLGMVTTDLNGQPITPINTFASFKPENVKDIELGVKGQYFDRALQVNAAVFHMWYTDVQKSALLPTPTGLTTFVSNTSAAQYDGFEMEAKWIITDAWMVQATYGYLDWAYKNSQDYTPSAPEHDYSLRVNYRVPLEVGDLNFDVNYAWRDQMFSNSSSTRSDLIAHPHSMVDEIGLVGARATLNLDSYGVTVGVWGQNLTDEKYTLTPLVLSTGAGLYAGAPGMPRTYGVDATYKF